MDLTQFLNNLKVTDLVVYAPAILGVVFGGLITWKIGRAGVKLVNSALNTPRKTFSGLGALVTLVGAPTAVWNLASQDIGLAAGVGLGGAFLASLSIAGLLKKEKDLFYPKIGAAKASEIREELTTIERLSNSNTVAKAINNIRQMLLS